MEGSVRMLVGNLRCVCFVWLVLSCGSGAAGNRADAGAGTGSSTGGLPQAGGAAQAAGSGGSGGSSQPTSGAGDAGRATIGGAGSGAGGSSGGSPASGAGTGGSIVPLPCEPSSGSAATAITLDGSNVKATNLNGLTFKGFGVLSANGTSELLMDYKSEHPEAYAQLLAILFGGEHPVMTHVKIEMGNDRNNSTGPDPATMRLASEAANVKRHPGFQLAADAKKLNPNLKVSILRWNAPGWVNTNDEVYTWFKATILAAYRTYGYMVDYVNPGLNERAADLNWTKQYAARLRDDDAGFENATERALYNAIQVVISDDVGIGSFGGNMTSDPSLRDAVSVAAYHYNTD